MWLAVGATILDAGIQATVNYSINPSLGWQVAIDKVDWGDAVTTGCVTAATAGTASEITIGRSINNTVLRTMSSAIVRGEIIKATVDYSPASPNSEERLKIAFVNKDELEVSLDFAFSSSSNYVTDGFLKEFKLSTKADLDVIKQKNNMKPVDRIQYKMMDEVANSPVTSEVTDKVVNFGNTSANQISKDALGVGEKNEDPSDKIKGYYDEINRINKTIYINLRPTLPDATRVEPRTMPRFQ